MRWIRRGGLLVGGVVLLVAASRGLAPAQGPAATPGRFEFEVTECYDSQYLGDTPGHLGRGGGLREAPDIALEDPVYHGSNRIGKISHLKWDRARNSLEVEIDPEPKVRVPIGQTVWVAIGGPAEKKPR